jgi:DNA helicase-2/ATP-dependent DNA helicase PcrA
LGRRPGRFGFNSPKPPSPAPAAAIRAGQQVFHNKFGEGRVLAVEGTGDDARAQVNFRATASSGWRCRLRS